MFYKYAMMFLIIVMYAIIRIQNSVGKLWLVAIPCEFNLVRHIRWE